jgi:redox-sensitive bicupin YhaK (pirin superfamily)
MTRDPFIRDGSAVLFGDGERVSVSAQGEPVRFLLMAGKPIREPVAWYGPIVMNTEEELETAFAEYRNGTFIKKRRS